MSKPDLVFMTDENRQQVMAEMARRQSQCAHEWERVEVKDGEKVLAAMDACKHCSVDKALYDKAVAEFAAEQT